MEIRSLCVCDHWCGGFSNPVQEGWEHKTLPMLSVVQSIRGSYAVSLGDGAVCKTEKMGVFVAPREVVQHICPSNDESGVMTAHWVFLDVEINRHYKLDDIYSFPLILPPKYNEEIYKLIRTISSEDDHIKKLPCLHRIIEILLEEGTLNEEQDEDVLKIKSYIENHYFEQISAHNIARHINCSISMVYKIFKEKIGMPPSYYVNQVRIRHAQHFLLNSTMTIGEIASAVGIQDTAYFSRLFRSVTGKRAGECRKEAQKRTTTASNLNTLYD